jgi:hypothetical protein
VWGEGLIQEKGHAARAVAYMLALWATRPGPACKGRSRAGHTQARVQAQALLRLNRCSCWARR